MRISTNVFYKNILSSIQRERLGAARAEEQIAFGQRINRLSEDPAALSQVMSLRTATSEIKDYVLSIDLQISRLNRAEEALAQATHVIQDARVLAVQGATGTYSPENLGSLALQVDQLINALVGFANASRGGMKPEGLFERTVVDGREIVVYTPPELWLGEQVTGEGWGRVLTLNMLVETVDPGAVFGFEEDEDGEGKRVLRATMFDTLFELRDRLADPQSAVSEMIGKLDSHMDTLLGARSDLGSRGYQLEKLQAQILVQNEQLTEVLSKIGDTDIVEAAIRINRHELVLQATLAAAARMMHVSLLNYLR